jgi:hypothetical protein
MPGHDDIQTRFKWNSLQLALANRKDRAVRAGKTARPHWRTRHAAGRRLRSLAIGLAISVLQDLQRCMIVVPSVATRAIASPQTGHHFVIVIMSVCSPRERAVPAVASNSSDGLVRHRSP